MSVVDTQSTSAAMSAIARPTDAAAVQQPSSSSILPATTAPLSQNVFVRKSLWVGNLPQRVDEKMLVTFFSQYGRVENVRINRHRETQLPLGHGYVNFSSHEEAVIAQKEANNKKIAEQAGVLPMRVMWPERNPANRNSGVGNIFIKGLPEDMEEIDLFDLLTSIGPVSSVRIARDPATKQSLRYGYAQFVTPDIAKAAIEALNGHYIAGKLIEANEYVPKDKRSSQQTSQFTNLFIKNIPRNITEEQFRELCSKHGNVKSAKLSGKAFPKYPDTTVGYCDFATHEDAIAAMSEQGLQNFEYHGKALSVQPFKPRHERERENSKRVEEMRRKRQFETQGRNLYVRNFPLTFTDKDLLEVFQQFGDVEKAKVAMDEQGNSKGFGYVCFNKVEEAAAVLNKRDTLAVGNKPLFVVLHQPKSIRSAQIQEQQRRRQMQFEQRMAANAGYPYAAQGMPFGQPLQQLYGMQRYPLFPMQPGNQMMVMSQQQPYTLTPAQFNASRNMARGHPSMNRPQRTGMPAMQQQQQQQQQAFQQQQQQAAFRQAQPPQVQRPVTGQSTVPSTVQPTTTATVASDSQPVTASAPTDFVQMLSKATPEDQKRMLGNRLYPLILSRVGNETDAGQYTGMLLTMDVSDILDALENPSVLAEHLEEARKLQAQAQQPAQTSQ